MKPGTSVRITRPGWEGKGVIKADYSKDYFLVFPEFPVSYGFGIVLHKKYLSPINKNKKKKK